jgi:tetratricopeptide (TPR) repeat protein
VPTTTIASAVTFEDWIRRAESQAHLGHLPQAVASLQRALALDERRADAWSLLGGWLHALGRRGEALDAASRVVALAPGVAAAWFNQSLALDALGRNEAALASVERALALEAAAPDLWCQRARLLEHLGRLDEALESARRALAPGPESVHAWTRCAGVLLALGRGQEALDAAQCAVELAPRDAAAWAQRGCALAALDRLEDAQSSLAHAARLAPDDAQVKCNLGMVQIARGDLPAGWEGYEWREAEAAGRGAGPAALDGVPIWRKDEDPVGRHIVVCSEQGIGDVILFCRYLPLLADRRASVSFVVQAQLHGLLGALDARLKIVDDAAACAGADRQCRLLSLAHRFGTTLETLPAPVPYLGAQAPLRGAWKERLAARIDTARGRVPRRIGLAFSGNPRNSNDRRRSLDVGRLAPVLGAFAGRPIEWHLLQAQLRPGDEAEVARLGIADHRSRLTDWSQTAALLSCMDAVLSVDTAIAHLAGAMGVPLFVLLSAAPDWRWRMGRTSSPWYPRAKLFVQERAGQWDEPLAAAAAALAAYLEPANEGNDGRD